MNFGNLARNFALVALVAASPLLLGGCLVIGNRGGLEKEDKQSLEKAQNRLNSLEARVSSLEMEGGAAGPDTLRRRLEHLQEENRRLSEELARHRNPSENSTKDK